MNFTCVFQTRGRGKAPISLYAFAKFLTKL
nr:MAG TPA: hypothetical protein [Caudoviricetes sp.]